MPSTVRRTQESKMFQSKKLPKQGADESSTVVNAASVLRPLRGFSCSGQLSLPLQGRRVLLVEDCPDQQRLLAVALRHSGADVTLECNGEAAVDAIVGSATPFDVVVMDLAMPLMDGIQATRLLRARGQAVPVIGITAYETEQTRNQWLAEGCNEFLAKPFDSAALVTAVQRLAADAVECRTD